MVGHWNSSAGKWSQHQARSVQEVFRKCLQAHSVPPGVSCAGPGIGILDDLCGFFLTQYILCFSDSEILEIRTLWNTISFLEVEWEDSACCCRCCRVPGLISCSLTSVVDVPGTMCTITCKFSGQRKSFRTQGNTEDSISNTSVSP